ncbi:MAG: peptidase M48 [Bacteroidetes bacterium]|nr:MAG: peptidase M48 [Bacteroidota bacterium]
MKRNLVPYRGLVLTLFVLTLSFFWDGCARNPVTGKKQFMLMSESQELAMGQQSDPSVVAEFGVYQDEAMQAFLNEKGQEMAAVSHRPELKYEFKLLDSPVVNAFALPGGYVYFTRGIMAHFNNEAQFAGVLGHEIGHVTARHSARQYSRTVLAQVGLIAGMIISPQFAQLGNEASQAMQLLLLKYGRDAESESDGLGVEYSSKIGYDAHEMAGFFKTLDRLTGGPEGRLPTFLSTHSDPANRNVRVGQLADQWQRKSNAGPYAVNRDSYLRLIDGMMYGEDPRQGFVENSSFYHPELKFQYPVPRDWQLLNSPQQVQMAPKDGKAVILLQLGQGASLEAAAQATAEKFKLQTTGSQRRTVNGLSALEVYADLVQEGQDANGQPAQQVLKTLSYYIQYGELIYHFLGLSTEQDFPTYRGQLLATMTGFNTLSDPDKLNRQADRLKVVVLPRAMSLREVFATYRQPSDRLEELAILNGMELTSQLPKGTLVKTIVVQGQQ